MAAPSVAGMPQGMSIIDWLNHDRKNSHEFTDFTIICEGQNFPVHRVIVSPKCDSLKKAMSGPWKEPQENQIDLKETKASIVSLFLDVIYEEPEKPVKPESFKLLSTWTRLYILGEKYIAPAAQNKARQMVQQLRQGPLTADDIIESLELLYSGMASKSFKFRDELIPVVVGYKKDLVHNPRFLELLRPEYRAAKIPSTPALNASLCSIAQDKAKLSNVWFAIRMAYLEYNISGK
ncbi:hypothetical protein MMC10_001280 [Thelotrema lepadinum]|nr:hypothetical protein [Thelotrema lepadinum]